MPTSQPCFRNDFIGTTTTGLTQSARKSDADGRYDLEFPILSVTVGPDVIRIAKLYAQSECSLRPRGFTPRKLPSKITYIDGDWRRPRNHAATLIEQLSEKGDFLDTCYPCSTGTLPTKAQKEDFDIA